MRADDDDIALIVQAFSFQLVNPLGDVAAQFGSTVGTPSLLFNHLNTDASLAPNPPGGQSSINWDEYGATGNVAINMKSASGPAGPSGLYLARTNAGTSATLDAGSGTTHVQAYESGAVRGISIGGGGGFVNIDTEGAASMTLDGTTGRVQVLTAGFAPVLDSDPWVAFNPVIVNVAGGFVMVAGATIYGRGQRLGRTFVGDWRFQFLAGSAAGVAGGQFILSGWPAVRAGSVVVIGHGYVYDVSADLLTTVVLLSNGGLYFTGGAAPYVRAGVPYVWALNDEIVVHLTYELA